MGETSIKDIFNYILSKIYIAIAVLILTVGAGEFYAAYLQVPMYKSTTQVVLISDSSVNTGITTNDVTLSNNLVKTYSEIAKSQNVLGQVVKNLGLKYDASALAGKMTVSSVSSTQLISIQITDKDAATAQKIADEVARVFKKEIASIYNIDNVQVVDKASLADTPYNVNITKQTIYYILAGIIFGLGIEFVMYCLDNSIKDSQTVEDRLGLTVLGVVPTMGKK